MSDQYFRVDKRLFREGDEVTSAQEYYGKFQPLEKQVEEELESSRPASKQPRNLCLFVFDDLKCAKKHWSKMKDGKLYRVRIDEASVFHRGDMALMDAMKTKRELAEEIGGLVLEYWNGHFSERPEPEILVSRAIVVEVISTNDAERSAYLLKRWKGEV